MVVSACPESVINISWKQRKHRSNRTGQEARGACAYFYYTLYIYTRVFVSKDIALGVVLA